MARWVTYEHPDGTLTIEWFEVFDGPWPYGELETKVFIKQENLYSNDTQEDNHTRKDSNPS
jgi:hypothetical protein